MTRTYMLLGLALVLSCGPADDAASGPIGSTGGAVGSRPAATPDDDDGPIPERRPAVPGEHRVRAVFLGTSLTAGLGLLRDSDRYTDVVEMLADSAGIPIDVVNAGVSGDTSAGGLRRLEWALQGGADVLVVELGANDGLRGQSPDALRDNLEAIIEGARVLSPGVRIVLAGMEAPPNLGEGYTTAFRGVFTSLAEAHGVTLVPFILDGVAGVPELNQADRIHPNPEGHRRIARTLWPFLEPVLRDAARAEQVSP